MDWDHGIETLGLGLTWRFMGSYKYRVISRITVVITYIRGLITLLRTSK